MHDLCITWYLSYFYIIVIIMNKETDRKKNLFGLIVAEGLESTTIMVETMAAGRCGAGAVAESLCFDPHA